MNSSDCFQLRRSNERGHADHGWLKTYHSFSFGEYHDVNHMGFRSLRVINEDFIAPLGGFPTHPHRDMEIFSYVVEGELAHEDNMGNSRRIRPGEIQVMSAGSGVTHSEYNPLQGKSTHMLQVWIMPDEKGLPPRYTEWKPPAMEASNPKVLLISGDGRDGSATIAQDADVWRLKLQPGEQIRHTLKESRGMWLQMIKGSAEIGGLNIQAGDAVSTAMPADLNIFADDVEVEALLFDLS